jgi:predicted AAA+ superfamily ATPase
MSAYGCETLLFLEGFNSRNYYDGAIGEKKTNQFIEKKRTTQCNCKEWDRKDSRERIESKIEKELFRLLLNQRKEYIYLEMNLFIGIIN